MASVNINTWWIDSGSTIHIANSLQGMQNLRKLVGSEQSIFLGNKLGSPMEAIETCILTLSSDFILKLERTFYVPSFSQNLISVSRIVLFGYPLILKTHCLSYFIILNVLGMVSCLVVIIFY